MLEIIVLVFAIIAMVRGKFSLGADKVLHGTRARITAGILLAHLPLSFMAGLLLAMTGNADLVQGGGAILIGLGLLIAIVVLTLIVGNILYKQQEAQSQSGPYDEV